MHSIFQDKNKVFLTCKGICCLNTHNAHILEIKCVYSLPISPSFLKKGNPRTNHQVHPTALAALANKTG